MPFPKTCPVCHIEFSAREQAVKFCSRKCYCAYPHPAMPLAERFWSHVLKTDTCWLWQKGRTSTGYGSFKITRTRGIKAHRFVYELTYGPIPAGLFVCHHCDVPLCVRPDHLFLGTAGDNLRDMVRKGRHYSTVHPEMRSGERSGMAKLTDAKVREIRALHATGQVSMYRLAKDFGVTQRVIHLVVRRLAWKHVD